MLRYRKIYTCHVAPSYCWTHWRKNNVRFLFLDSVQDHNFFCSASMVSTYRRWDWRTFEPVWYAHEVSFFSSYTLLISFLDYRQPRCFTFFWDNPKQSRSPWNLHYWRVSTSAGPMSSYPLAESQANGNRTYCFGYPDHSRLLECRRETTIGFGSGDSQTYFDHHHGRGNISNWF